MTLSRIIKFTVTAAAILLLSAVVSCKNNDNPINPAETTSGLSESSLALVCADGFTLEGDIISAEVEYETESMNVGELIRAEDGATFELFTDEKTENKTETPILPLSVGENTYFIRVSKNEKSRIYTLIIIREVKMHTVYMYTTGGTFIKPRKVADGEGAASVTPLRDGYAFDGWYNDGVKYDFSTAVTSDLLLVAHWKKTGSFTSSDISAVTYTKSSAALNIVWKDYDDKDKLRPSSVRCILTRTDAGNDEAAIIVTSGGARWENSAKAPEGAVLSSGSGGRWTVKVSGLNPQHTYSFVQEPLGGDYTTLQSSTSSVNTVKGYRPNNDESAWLTTADGHLYDLAGNTIVLRGVVSVNVGMAKFSGLLSLRSLIALKSLGVNAVRMTVQLESPSETSQSYSYCYSDGTMTNKSSEEVKNKLFDSVCEAIDTASSLGIYSVIDWGVLNRNPNLFYADAAAFYAKLAEKYASNPYVIYEICNEPNSTWGIQRGEELSVKHYSEKMISVIRSRGSRGIIIVAPNACSTALSVYSGSAIAGDDPIDDPIADDLAWNVAYTFHCYPYNYAYNDPNATSYSWKLRDAISAGFTVITTEMSPIDATLSQKDELAYDMNEAAKYLNLYLENDLSIFYFRYSSPSEYSEWYMFKPAVNVADGNWSSADMTICGKWYYDILRGNGFIEAADFSAPRHQPKG